MANFSGPTFEFADDSPLRSGRKHRRGRGYNTGSRGGGGSNSNRQTSSYSSTGGHHSNVASQVLHTGQADHYPKQSHGHPQYYTSGWDDNNNTPSKQSGDQDHNSCSGSLTYSASSSIQSGLSSGGESSNDSSFADIIKLLDSEGEGASEIKAFIAARTEAANNEGGPFQLQGSARNSGAVAGWMQRVDERNRQHLQQKQLQHAKKSSSSKRDISSNVDLNYSRDDSDDDELLDGDMLDTIAVRDEDPPIKTNIKVITRSRGDPFSMKPSSRAQSDGPSTPRRSGTTTPPPDARSKRTSTPPNAYASISRTNSHRSKSSSDGSWDTPTKSPPHGNSHTKPPHTSRRPAKSSSTPRGGKKKSDGNSDISEAVYNKFWMCGFTDAFNFDKFQK
ncbi:hypothetical protein ACHAXS_006933 [Conticribra weissflogii]